MAVGFGKVGAGWDEVVGMQGEEIWKNKKKKKEFNRFQQLMIVCR